MDDRVERMICCWAVVFMAYWSVETSQRVSRLHRQDHRCSHQSRRHRNRKLLHFLAHVQSAVHLGSHAAVHATVRHRRNSLHDQTLSTVQNGDLRLHHIGPAPNGQSGIPRRAQTVPRRDRWWPDRLGRPQQQRDQPGCQR